MVNCFCGVLEVLRLIWGWALASEESKNYFCELGVASVDLIFFIIRCVCGSCSYKLIKLETYSIDMILYNCRVFVHFRNVIFYDEIHGSGACLYIEIFKLLLIEKYLCIVVWNWVISWRKLVLLWSSKYCCDVLQLLHCSLNLLWSIFCGVSSVEYLLWSIFCFIRV